MGQFADTNTSSSVSFLYKNDGAERVYFDPWTMLFSIFFIILISDQVRYLVYKKHIAGPRFTIPIMGAFLDSMNPRFQGYMDKWKSGPLSCVSVFHKFVVIASTRDLSRKIFNSPAFVKPCVVDIAVKLLRPTNWVFLDGKAHVEYRKGLNNLFTKKAMGIYLPGQEEIYDKYLQLFLDMSKQGPVAFMPILRELNCATSLRTFCGHYISDGDVKRISDDYYLITKALELVNFPIIIPFTNAWYGRKACDMVMDMFEKCAAQSRRHILAGGSVTCTMDEWIKEMVEAKRHAEKGENDAIAAPIQIRDFSDSEIAQTIFTFLFASQDATSSASTFLFQTLADRPEVMAKVREEQLAVRDGDANKRLDMDIMGRMVYTRAVVKELLRWRPPVIMVPYKVKKDYPITPDYTIPKGAMVIPSTWPALHDPEVYPDPDEFIPERWLEGGTAEAATKNWLVFGVGPHVCLGQNYAIMHLMALMGKATLTLDWTHIRTPLSDEITVFATLFPSDNLILQFSERASIATT